jgi:peptidoglycan/LPS O-acetylase OafA/YrhL
VSSTDRPKYIPTLDGLRAVAIVIVIASHTVSRLEHQRILNLGHMAVLIFFALSGFLITTLLLDEFDLTGTISLRRFYLRRVFRILPPALFYLAVLSALTWSGLVACSWPTIRSALFFYTNYADIQNSGWFAGHFWSLSVEEHFYLLWPCLLLLAGVRRGWRVAAAIAVAVAVWSVLDYRFQIFATVFHEPYQVMNAFRTDLMADTLLWGCCLAFYLRWPGRKVLSSKASTGLAVFALVLLLAPDALKIERSSFVLLHFAPALLLGAIVSAPSAPIGRFLEWAPVRFVGRLSYSLYIWQQLFLRPFGQRLPIPVALMVIPVCAFLSYKLIEQPMIRFGKRFLVKPVLRGMVAVGD